LRSVHWIFARTEPTTLNGTAATVAVRTANLAFIELTDEALRAASASHKAGDVFGLRLKMIELKHERIRNAAVDARLFAKW